MTVLVHKCADTSSTADAVPLPLEGKAKAEGGQTLVKRWDAGFEAAARNKGKGNKKSPARGEGVNQSIRDKFYSEFDAWDGKSKTVFHIGETSAVLKHIGVKDTGVIWHNGKITEINLI